MPKHNSLQLQVKKSQDKFHNDGLMQERLNSSALAMELHISCINRPIWSQSLQGFPGVHHILLEFFEIRLIIAIVYTK